MSSFDSATAHRRGTTAGAHNMDAVGRFDEEDDSSYGEHQQQQEEDMPAPSSSVEADASKKSEPSPPDDPEVSKTSSASSASGSHTADESKQEKDTEETDRRPISMEIGQAETDDEDLDEFDTDLERLLGDTPRITSSTTTNTRTSRCCLSSYKIGETRVVCPRIYQKTKWLGLIGPHWFGPLCTLGLILWGSHHFIKLATKIGPITLATCVAFTTLTVVSLVGVSCGDPGIVRDAKPHHSLNMDNWRWCDLCSVYQPPDGAHCPDCKVCVAGYDHHCVWMGTCIGRKNFRAFKIFNLSWLFYLIYCIVWVSIVAPSIFSEKDGTHDDTSGVTNSTEGELPND